MTRPASVCTHGEAPGDDHLTPPATPKTRSTHRGDASPCIVYSTPGANPYNQRKLERRAVLQTNRMPAFVALARNAVLSANLRPNVQPVDDKADVKTAEVLSALIRNTEHLSQVEAVYTTAIDAMAENGRGYVQVVTEYADDDTFNQRPRLKRVLNPFRVRVDPSAEEPDQRDAEYAFLETDYDADTWKEEFGGPGVELPTKDSTDWTGADTIARSASWTGIARSTRTRSSTNSTTARRRPGSRSWTPP